ncbi:MAG: hypothetical protein J7M26_02960 [Armatimonadetes bacterium]|nr:hypothetical protein [Armatimonadota bacterium]
MRAPGVVVALLSFLLAVPAVSIFPAQTLKSWDFEQGMEGWQTPDNQANLTLALGTGAADGTGALVLSYDRADTAVEMQQRGIPGAVVVTLPTPLTADASCLSFSVKTTVLTPLVVGFDEEDGSRYEALVLVPPGKWRKAKIFFSRLRQSEDSQDENGKLDPDQIAHVSFVDGSVFWVVLTSQMVHLPITFPKVSLGKNELYLDSVSITDEKPPTGPWALEDASREVLHCMALLGADATVEHEDAGLQGKPDWHIVQPMREKDLSVLFWPTPAGYFNNTLGVHVVLQSKEGITMILQVKEADGSEYNAILPLQGTEVLDEQFLWADFTLGDDSTDENGKLDPEQITQVMIGDATGFIAPAAHTLDLRLGLVDAIR